MADITIGGLTQVSALAAGDKLELEQGEEPTNTSGYATLEQLADWLAAEIGGGNAGSPSVEVTASTTLALTHAGKFISANHASTAIVLTVPPNSSTAFPVDTEVHIRRRGASAVSVAAGSGVTINQPASQTKVLAEQYSVATLKKVATDTWALFGDLGAAP